MEELENRNNNIIEEPIRKITVKASEIIKKFRAYKERQLFCKELSKFSILKKYRFIFP